MCNVTGSGGLWGKLDPTSKAIANRTGEDPAHLFTDAPDPNAAANAASAAEAARQKSIQDALDSISKVFDSPDRQAEYTKYGTDTYNLLKHNLDDTTRGENRNLRFSLSRSGNLGGSQDVYDNGLVQKDYNTGLINAQTQATGAQHSLESADQQTKLALDQMAMNGLSANDSETQALNAAKINTLNEQGQIMPATADSLFGDIAIGYGNRQVANGAAAANAPAQQPTGLGGYFDYTPTATSLDPFAEGSNPSGEA